MLARVVDATRCGGREPLAYFNIAAIGIFAVLRRAGKLRGQHFHLYLIAYGLFRFAHEFLRATPRLSHGITGYQIAALAVAGLGAAGFVRRARGA